MCENLHIAKLEREKKKKNYKIKWMKKKINKQLKK